jgi:catalase
MATKKKPARSSRVKSKAKYSVKEAQGTGDVLRTNDVIAEQANASNDFVAAMLYNRVKALEYGHDNAVAPRGSEQTRPLLRSNESESMQVIDR